MTNRKSAGRRPFVQTPFARSHADHGATPFFACPRCADEAARRVFGAQRAR